MNQGGVSLSMFKDKSMDRIFSTFVIDLLSYEDIEQLFDEAHRVLQPGMCYSSLQ